MVNPDELGFDSFFDGLVKDLQMEFSSDFAATNIIDFIDNEVDVESWLGKGGALTDRQRILLKIYDGVELDEDEIAIVEAWKALDRTSYDLDLGPRKRQAFIAECGRNAGKCLDVNSLVLTKEHGLAYAYELLPTTDFKAGFEFPVNFTVSLEGSNNTAKAQACYVKGLSKTVRFTTRAGYSLNATPEHRVKVLGVNGKIQWKYLADIKVGDYVGIHRTTALFPEELVSLEHIESFVPKLSSSNTNSFCRPSHFDADWGYLMGLLLSDGLWGYRNRVEISLHKEDKTHCISAFNACGLSSRYYDSSDNGGSLKVYSVELRYFLDQLGYSLDVNMDNKLTPWVIRKSPKEVQAKYLSGLFDGDGTVSKEGREISLSTVSRQLAEETQLLLLNFGVVSSIINNPVNGKMYYNLTLRGQRSVRVFAEQIGFSLERKQKRVLDYLARNGYVEHFKTLAEADYFYDPVVSVEESEALCVDFCVPGHEQYVAQGMTNHNTFLGSIILGYEWYKLCMLKNPQAFFGVAASTLISIYCLAPAASQTKKTIFGQSKAFLNYIPKVKRLIDSKQILVGEEEIKYPEKLLYIYAGNSKGSTQVGSRVILMIMDEVARFESKDGESNALELWSNVGVSGITFGEHARRVAISSAWCEGDAIQRLWNASKTEDSWIGFRFRTWDLNPKMNRDNPIIASEYKLDPINARLEFEGDRSASAYSFFNEHEVNRAFRGRVQADIQRCKDLGDNLVRLTINDINTYHGLSYVHLDPAIVRDAYALVAGHGEMNTAGNKIVVIDAVAAWEPQPGQQVSVLNVHDIIFQINQARPIYKITTDHAQQAETIQRLRMSGLSASSMFFSNKLQVEIYDATRKMLHEDRIILPKDSPWSNLLRHEMMTIQFDQERRKIDHSPDSSKDVLDCLCAVVWHIAGDQFGNVKLERVSRKPRYAGTMQSVGSNTFSYDDEDSFNPGRRTLVKNRDLVSVGMFQEYDF